MQSDNRRFSMRLIPSRWAWDSKRIKVLMMISQLWKRIPQRGLKRARNQGGPRSQAFNQRHPRIWVAGRDRSSAMMLIMMLMMTLWNISLSLRRELKCIASERGEKGGTISLVNLVIMLWFASIAQLMDARLNGLTSMKTISLLTILPGQVKKQTEYWLPLQAPAMIANWDPTA